MEDAIEAIVLLDHTLRPRSGLRYTDRDLREIPAARLHADGLDLPFTTTERGELEELREDARVCSVALDEGLVLVFVAEAGASLPARLVMPLSGVIEVAIDAAAPPTAPFHGGTVHSTPIRDDGTAEETEVGSLLRVVAREPQFVTWALSRACSRPCAVGTSVLIHGLVGAPLQLEAGVVGFRMEPSSTRASVPGKVSFVCGGPAAGVRIVVQGMDGRVEERARGSAFVRSRGGGGGHDISIRYGFGGASVSKPGTRDVLVVLEDARIFWTDFDSQSNTPSDVYLAAHAARRAWRLALPESLADTLHVWFENADGTMHASTTADTVESRRDFFQRLGNRLIVFHPGEEHVERLWIAGASGVISGIPAELLTRGSEPKSIAWFPSAMVELDGAALSEHAIRLGAKSMELAYVIGASRHRLTFARHSLRRLPERFVVSAALDHGIEIVWRRSPAGDELGRSALADFVH